MSKKSPVLLLAQRTSRGGPDSVRSTVSPSFFIYQMRPSAFQRHSGFLTIKDFMGASLHVVH